MEFVAQLRLAEPTIASPQGKKHVDLGKQSYVFGESTFLLTSIELPIVSRVCVASVEKPYLAFFLKLDTSTNYSGTINGQTEVAYNGNPSYLTITVNTQAGYDGVSSYRRGL